MIISAWKFSCMANIVKPIRHLIPQSAPERFYKRFMSPITDYVNIVFDNINTDLNTNLKKSKRKHSISIITERTWLGHTCNAGQTWQTVLDM